MRARCKWAVAHPASTIAAVPEPGLPTLPLVAHHRYLKAPSPHSGHDKQGHLRPQQQREPVAHTRAEFGKRLLFTTRTTLTTEQILELYNRDKVGVEKDFHCLKAPNLVRFQPMRHYTDTKIRSTRGCGPCTPPPLSRPATSWPSPIRGPASPPWRSAPARAASSSTVASPTHRAGRSSPGHRPLGPTAATGPPPTVSPGCASSAPRLRLCPSPGRGHRRPGHRGSVPPLHQAAGGPPGHGPACCGPAALRPCGELAISTRLGYSWPAAWLLALEPVRPCLDRRGLPL